MVSVAVNPPKTPVTTGSNSIAAATIPNICKMPGPPAPFVPTPLPNIGRSGLSPKKYTKDVLVEGHTVAVKGASFGSQGDMASKATGGGLISSNTHGPTKFIGPGSLDVKFEGRNVQLLGDPMLNNCGPSGSPPNSATLAGVLHPRLAIHGTLLDVTPELQVICDTLCECLATVLKQKCISDKLDARDKGAKYHSKIKSEVPYVMKPSPTPIMSKTEPMRPSRNWFIPGHRRPDAVIVKDPHLPPIQTNIAAVVEIKIPPDRWRLGQRKAYETIAGSEGKLIEMNTHNCQCPRDKRPDEVPVHVPVPVPVSEKAPKRVDVPDTEWSPIPALVVVGTIAAVVGLAAIAASSAPAFAAVALFALFSTSP